jgi:Putative transposase DNA-binding domain
MNRKLSSWRRGKIQNRIAFKALAEGFRHEQVNAAYGSQTCPCCGFVDSKNRIHDKFKCSYCEHEDIADRVAAMNYARRFGDHEIGLYTPYSQVKTILLSRFYRRLEMGLPMTVPGQTLETVAKVHPPLGRDNIIAGRDKNLTEPGGHSESETNKYVSIRF